MHIKLEISQAFSCIHRLFTQSTLIVLTFYSLSTYIQLIHAFGIQRYNRQQTHCATSQRKPFLYARLQSLSLLSCAELQALLWKQILSRFLFITQQNPSNLAHKNLLSCSSSVFHACVHMGAYVLPPTPPPPPKHTNKHTVQ